MSEDRYGYTVKVETSLGKTTSHSSWSEGSPLVDQKIKSKIIDTLPTMGLKTLVGGGFGVTAIFATAGFAGGTLGNGISALLMNTLNRALLRSAEVTFSQKTTSVNVTISGDFQAKYKIGSIKDLKLVPALLSIIPATFTVDNKPYWMGKDIIECLANEQLGACIKGGNISAKYSIDV